MHRKMILKLIEEYYPSDKMEQLFKEQTLNFIVNNPTCFERSCIEGHITGSAWIVNSEFTHALLIHHKKLNKWFQPGGHCDGNPDVQFVAKKEVLEETGVNIKLVYPEIFDLDIHNIPATEKINSHFHFDIRFLFVAQMEKLDMIENAEVKKIEWVPLDLIKTFTADNSILRMVLKSRNVF